jgi:hypothetical protein
MTCGTEVRDIDFEILSLSILPKNSSFATTIPISSKTQVAIPIESVGSGSHNFDFKIEGPLSRIADSDQTLRLTESDDFLTVDIDPNNLLSNNMIVNGVIEITDSNDNVWIIEIVLTAENSAANSLNDYISPGQMVGLACIFAALWIFLTMKDNQPKKIEEIIEKEYDQPLNNQSVNYDAWGRLIDD